jgi:hypothetical protein
VSYGLNIQAWCVFLLAVHHVPVERCAGIIAALTGTRPSGGFVHAMLARAAKAVRGVNMLIRDARRPRMSTTPPASNHATLQPVTQA